MKIKPFASLIFLFAFASGLCVHAQMFEPKTVFKVKYVANGAVYLDGGANDALSVGMKIRIHRDTKGAPATDLEFLSDAIIVSVASTSAACELQPGGLDVQVGDIAEPYAPERKVLQQRTVLKTVKKYAQVVSFTEDDDPMQEDLRAALPVPHSPEENRIRGMMSFDYSAISDHTGVGSKSEQEGVALRADMTRIGGTYWNFTGYWHGRRTARGGGGRIETLNDLMNRTYHIGFYYNNPKSNNMMGVGRLSVPWAGSLGTIDGGYFGHRFGKVTTLGIFAGSTPDPTAWNFDPSRRIGGVFTSFEAGRYDALRYVGTMGLALAMLHGRAEREYGFFENTLSFDHGFSVYQNAEVDYAVNQATPVAPAAMSSSNVYLSRNFLTVRFQPKERLSFDFGHNYFKNVPTADVRLIGTGLLDPILFTGLNGGFRLRVVGGLSVYSNVGKSDQSKDTKSSWNTMYGIAINRLPFLNARMDLRMSKFDSSFGSGTYRTLQISKAIGQSFHLDVQAGQQNFRSAFTAQNKARFINSNMDWFLSRHYALGGGMTIYRGETQNYEQWFFSLGYRF